MTKSKGGYRIRPDGKKDTGRPTVMTQKTIDTLEEAFLIGASDAEACLKAGISMATLYNYQNEHPDYIERKQELKENLTYRARQVIANKIKDNDGETAKWYLERKKKAEFSTRQELTAEDGKNLMPTIEIMPVSVINADDE